MPIKIVDADINRLRTASRSGRSRSQETLRLMRAIDDLRPGRAKALLPEQGESMARLRSRLNYAARASGHKLRVVTDQDRVLFALRGGAVSRPRAGGAERREAVQKKALALAKGGRGPITAESVLKAMAADGVKFDVARPATMVGAVLRAMPEFERTGKNQFRYKG
jgi:hypothetical protein